MLLTEFPYPSGNLHIGHWYAFAVPDIFARYLRMNNKNVMYPIGFDAFGLPAENAAIKRGINPRKWTEKNISFMTKQLNNMGAAFDWNRKVSTIDPEYYKWTQWIFLQMFKKNLAYRTKTFVNWCPKDKTVLANEQVVNGRCERCGALVVQKEFEQWMLRITKYADRLIDDIEKLDWPETTKLAQKNWIGRSQGINFKEKVKDLNIEFEVYDSIPQTFLAQTFTVIAPEHPLVEKLIIGTEYEKPVREFVEKIKQKKAADKFEIEKESEGIFTGRYVDNPFGTGDFPIWVASYVVADYGTGIVNCSAHDERDFAFAKKYDIPLKIAMLPSDKIMAEKVKNFEECYLDPNGILQKPAEVRGMNWTEARKPVIEYIENKGFGKRTTHYRLRDWVISRQRYWGVPIPVIHCEKCGYVPVPEKNLPVELPKLKDFLPTGEGKSPLAKAKKWVDVDCPKCKGKARRETDTMDTFVDSSWYFIRYTDPKNKNKFADRKKMKKWLPVPLYIGGAEHNTMHLLYSRFFTKVLYDLKLAHFNEPFVSRRNHGTILGPDGQKMSKSKGNVIDPDAEVKKYGADSVRMYLAFMGPYDQGGPWQFTGITGISRFLQRVFNISKNLSDKTDREIEKTLHQIIKKVGEDIESLRFNTAISGLMIFLNKAEKNSINKKTFEDFLKLLAPFAPHLSEEIWKTNLNNKKSIHIQPWPKYSNKMIAEENFELVIQINGKVRDKILAKKGVNQEQAEKLAVKSSKIKNIIAGRNIKKTIFVPDRLINIIL